MITSKYVAWSACETLYLTVPLLAWSCDEMVLNLGAALHRADGIPNASRAISNLAFDVRQLYLGQHLVTRYQTNSPMYFRLGSDDMYPA